MEDIIHLMENQPDGFEPNEKTKAYLFDMVLTLNKKKNEAIE